MGAGKIPRAVWCGYWNALINRSWLPMKNVRISALPSGKSKLGNDVFIPEEASMEADNGERVLVRILDYGNARKNPEGRVVEILGPANAPGRGYFISGKGLRL